MRRKNLISEIFLLISTISLFFIIFVNTRWMLLFVEYLLKHSWLPIDIRHFLDQSPQDIVTDLIGPFRGIIFVFSLAFLIILIWKDTVQIRK